MRLLSALVLLLTLASTTAQAQSGDVLVTSVVDGDTFEVLTPDGESQRVRVMGLDAPEVVNPRRPVGCLGPEAAARATQLLKGQRVRLEPDLTQEEVDPAGAVIAHVWLADGRSFAQVMLEEGLALERTYRGLYPYRRELRGSEQAARSAGRGLWASDTCFGKQAPLLDPNDALSYLVPEAELPLGFTHVGNDVHLNGGAYAQGLGANFVRRNPQIAPNDVTEIGVSSALHSSASAAHGLMLRLQEALPEGTSVEELPGVLGDETFVSRYLYETEQHRPVEGLGISFRRGAWLGQVYWVDYADLPNYDDALEIARLLDHRVAVLLPRFTRVMPTTFITPPAP